MLTRVEQRLQRHPELMRRLRRLLTDSPAFERAVWTLRGKQMLILDYPVRSEPRYGHGRPSHPRLHDLISRNDSSYAATLEYALQLREAFTSIPRMPSPGGTAPSWFNGWLPALDMVANYALLARHRPRRYVEIGSGESTKLARRAITDLDLDTTITSIDPQPRAEVDGLCDRVVRRRLEDADLSVFADLEPGDAVFFDGSHRCFMNSDVAVFFLEVLPALPAGVLVGIHDIDLPWDHPAAWAGRYYNEQYLLATYLLTRGPECDIVLPSRYVTITPALHEILEPLWTDPHLAEVPPQGGAFWFRA